MVNESAGKPHRPSYCFLIRKHKILCVPCNRPECGLAGLLEADTSNFHTDPLAEATRAINEIIAAVPPDPEGRRPAFIQTSLGIMLVWVEHHDDPAIARDEDVVTSADDDDTLAKALNLKNY